MMSNPAHILSLICINLGAGGGSEGVDFCQCRLHVQGCVPQPERLRRSTGSGRRSGKDALVYTLVGHLCVCALILAHESESLPFSLPGHSWDRTGWIEPCIALISTTVQTGWVSTEPLQGTSGWAGAAQAPPWSPAPVFEVPLPV